jgi:PatG C-terminal
MSPSVLNSRPGARGLVRPQATPQQACADGTCDNGDVANSGETGPYPFVYAIGNIDIRFPSLGVEKEFAQVSGRTDTAGLSDQQVLQRVLAEPQNRYLSRQVCWVFTIEGLDTYLLQPREAADFELLLEAVRANPSRQDVDVVVGLRGPLAPPTMCNGLSVPIVAFSQIYSFDRDSFVKAVPVPEGQQAEGFPEKVNEIFDRILRVADNAGASDEHRALNYLATRYPAIYNLGSQQYAEGNSLTAIETAPSRLSGTRRMVTVSFVFTNRQTQVMDRYSVRVDVTEEFPFLASAITPTPYIDR